MIKIESEQAKIDADPNGPDVVRQDPNGPKSMLAGISVDYFNQASIDASGIDFESKYTMSFDQSSVELLLGWSRYLQYEVSSATGTLDAVGSFNFGSFVFERKQFLLVLNSGKSKPLVSRQSFLN